MSQAKILDYVEDFRAKRRPLIASALGLGSGLALNSFIMGIFAPHLISQFGWSKADFAMIGAFAGLVILTIPIVGRLVDLFGVRPIAAVGAVVTPLCFFAISRLSGSIVDYVMIFLVLNVFGVATTATVYTRPVVQNFDRTRGGALALVTSIPPLVGALGSPLIVMLNTAEGWRTGLSVVAAFMAVCGMIAVYLMPSNKESGHTSEDVRGKVPRRGDYRTIFTNRTFWLLFIATFLVSLPQVLTNSQLALVLIESGADVATAGSIVPAFAIGAVLGRISAGLALDRFPIERVASISLCLPGFGMLLLALPFDHPAILALSIFLVGLAFGAEGDILAYAVMRFFGLRIYSSVTGLVFAAIGLAATLGSVALSISISRWGGYDSFLVAGAIGVFFGSLLFLVIGRRPVAIEEDRPNGE